jgi:diguanylate cyclase (GGDEF)-like protein
VEDEDEELNTLPLPTEGPAASPVRSAFLIVLSGGSIGKMFKVEGNMMVIGRDREADIPLHDEGVSRQHAKLVRDPEGEVKLVDLKSTNGTFVELERIDHKTLTDGDRIQIGSVTILKFSYRNELEEKFQQQLYESATRDVLTTAFNRRFFDEQLSKDFSYSRRHGSPFSLLIMDLDHFKAINDQHGHTVGDRVLKQMGTLLAESVRHEDIFCRIGGEEFAAIMREADDAQAEQMAERLRGLVENSHVDLESGPLKVTISVGAATFDRDKYATAQALVEAADQALYAAKRAGRNRVCAAE